MISAEIQSACDAIMNEGRRTEIPVLGPEAPLPLFDSEDRDVLVQGDLALVHVVKSERSVLILGSIHDAAQQVIRVEAKGDIVVTGSVYHAQLTGRRVLINDGACFHAVVEKPAGAI